MFILVQSLFPHIVVLPKFYDYLTAVVECTAIVECSGIVALVLIFANFQEVEWSPHCGIFGKIFYLSQTWAVLWKTSKLS